MARDDRRHYHHAHCSPKIFHTRGRQLHRHTPSRLRTLIAETAALAGAEVVVGIGAALTVEHMRFCGEENFMLTAFRLVEELCCTASLHKLLPICVIQRCHSCCRLLHDSK